MNSETREKEIAARMGGEVFSYEIRHNDQLVGAFPAELPARDGGKLTYEKMVKEFFECAKHLRNERPDRFYGDWSLWVVGPAGTIKLSARTFAAALALGQTGAER